MGDLVIRFGSDEGPRNPTLADIRQALEDIESRVNPRPELCIENVDSYKPVLLDGEEVFRYAPDEPHMTAAAVYRDEEEPGAPLGWLILYQAADGSRSALSGPRRRRRPFLDAICFGAPHRLRSSCVVPRAVALDALAYFAQYRERSPAHKWIPESECFGESEPVLPTGGGYYLRRFKSPDDWGAIREEMASADQILARLRALQDGYVSEKGERPGVFLEGPDDVLGVGLGKGYWVLMRIRGDECLYSWGNKTEGSVLFCFPERTELSRRLLIPSSKAQEVIRVWFETGTLSDAVQWTDDPLGRTEQEIREGL